jgi:hypothetical protein
MTSPRVYACFDARGSKNPTATDLKYYFLLRAWGRRPPLAQAFVDVHGVAPSFKRASSDIRGELAKRLRDSDLLLLILSERTPATLGWVSWEIDFAAHCGLPIVCAYPGRDDVDEQGGHRPWWPDTLCRLVSERRTRPVHVPFRPRALAQAFNGALGGASRAGPEPGFERDRARTGQGAFTSATCYADATLDASFDAPVVYTEKSAGVSGETTWDLASCHSWSGAPHIT